jgi:hypothetical protein
VPSTVSVIVHPTESKFPDDDVALALRARRTAGSSVRGDRMLRRAELVEPLTHCGEDRRDAARNAEHTVDSRDGLIQHRLHREVDVRRSVWLVPASVLLRPCF